MSSKRLDAISDYARHDYRLKVECRSCGHTSKLEPDKLVALCMMRGWSRQMSSVEARLRCQKCGKRDVRCGPAF